MRWFAKPCCGANTRYRNIHMTVAQGETWSKPLRTPGDGVVHNFQLRDRPCLNADIPAGVLGTITGIDAAQFGNPGRRLPDWYEGLPLGLFYDESPHLLYLMQSIAGPLRLSNSVIIPSRRGLATPARITAWFTAETSDYPIQLSCNFESPVSEWYLMVFGEKPLGIIDVFRDITSAYPTMALTTRAMSCELTGRDRAALASTRHERYPAFDRKAVLRQ